MLLSSNFAPVSGLLSAWEEARRGRQSTLQSRATFQSDGRLSELLCVTFVPQPPTPGEGAALGLSCAPQSTKPLLISCCWPYELMASPYFTVSREDVLCSRLFPIHFFTLHEQQLQLFQSNSPLLVTHGYPRDGWGLITVCRMSVGGPRLQPNPMRE